MSKYAKARQATICELILTLYKQAVANNWKGIMFLLEVIYLDAKKMNRKLIRYKHGRLIKSVANESFREKDWINDLKEIRDKGGCDGSN